METVTSKSGLPERIFKYVGAERVDILENLKIRFTSPIDFNDPFDLRPVIKGFDRGALSRFQRKASERAYWKQVMQGSSVSRRKFDRQMEPRERKTAQWIEQNPEYVREVLSRESHLIYRGIGILSLTEEENNILMWSHYAESHAGLLIELEPAHDFFSAPGRKIGHDFGVLWRVLYSDERPIFDFGGAIDPAIFATKSTHWKYEREWRVFQHLNGQPIFVNERSVYFYELPPKCIKRVVLGVRSSQRTADRLMAAIGKNHLLGHVIVEKACEDLDRFVLNYIPLASSSVVLPPVAAGERQGTWTNG